MTNNTDTCQYFAYCGNPATFTVPNRILGPVPACERCYRIYHGLTGPTWVLNVIHPDESPRAVESLIAEPSVLEYQYVPDCGYTIAIVARDDHEARAAAAAHLPDGTIDDCQIAYQQIETY